MYILLLTSLNICHGKHQINVPINRKVYKLRQIKSGGGRKAQKQLQHKGKGFLFKLTLSREVLAHAASWARKNSTACTWNSSAYLTFTLSWELLWMLCIKYSSSLIHSFSPVRSKLLLLENVAPSSSDEVPGQWHPHNISGDVLDGRGGVLLADFSWVRGVLQIPGSVKRCSYK